MEKNDEVQLCGGVYSGILFMKIRLLVQKLLGGSDKWTGMITPIFSSKIS
jgi:hypothetical protein